MKTCLRTSDVEILIYLFDTVNTSEEGRILLTHSHKRLHRVRMNEEVKNLLSKN